jgi:hypothetical protein
MLGRMHPKLKRKLAIGAAVVAAVAFAGGAYAATQDPPVSVRQVFLNDIAKRLNVTPQQLTSAIKGAYLDELSNAVAEHNLTKAQAGAIERAVQRSGSFPLGGLVAPFPLAAIAKQQLVAPAPGLPLPFAVFGGLGAAAKYLGVKTPMQLAYLLGSGKSLAQIAQARGKTVAGVENAIMASERSMLDRLVANKLITSAREQRLLARLSKRIDALVNRAGLRALLPAPLAVRAFKFRIHRGFAPPLPVLPFGP